MLALVIKGLAAATIIVGIFRGPGCGEVDHPENGANAPCTRDRDCESGLLCQQGVCVPPPQPVGDASTNDASSIDDAGSDAIADAAATDG